MRYLKLTAAASILALAPLLAPAPAHAATVSNIGSHTAAPSGFGEIFCDIFVGVCPPAY